MILRLIFGPKLSKTDDSTGIFLIVFLHKGDLEAKTLPCILPCAKFEMLSKVKREAVNLGDGDGMQFPC